MNELSGALQLSPSRNEDVRPPPGRKRSKLYLISFDLRDSSLDSDDVCASYKARDAREKVSGSLFLAMVSASSLRGALGAAAVVFVLAVKPVFSQAQAAATGCNPLVNNVNCSYDYVVIGGGTAGLVVAARLSENPNLTVAVIEAGPSAKGDERIDVPANIGTPIGSELDWKVNTVPQRFSNDVVYNWPRGKVLGGSSALNFLVWDRAAKAEYDAWESLGNQGWNWNSIFST